MRGLAFSTNAFKKNTLAEALDAIAAIGYTAAEVMADVPHADPAALSAVQRQSLLRHLRDLNLAVSNVNAFTLFACGDTYHPTWIEHDASARQARVRHTVGAIELAGELGAATISIQPGGPLIGTGLTVQQASDRFAQGLAEVLPHARKLGIVLAIEPEPGLLIQSAREYTRFKSQYFAGDPQVRMNCDIGHLFCVGDDPAGVIRSMPHEIAHVHVEDIGANRVHQHLAPGKGVIDFGAVFAALRDVGYGGFATVELYPYQSTAAEVARAAYDRLRPLL
jgi:sugar phosphate isomerase/epimerase